MLEGLRARLFYGFLGGLLFTLLGSAIGGCFGGLLGGLVNGSSVGLFVGLFNTVFIGLNPNRDGHFRQRANGTRRRCSAFDPLRRLSWQRVPC
ncbi:MAG: hypothetical protein R2748_22285 [Bryobacterales bacterium]